jgi:casein kinase II subunit alpha
MFKGADNEDQLLKIAMFMGTADLMEYVRKYKLTIKSVIAKRIQNWERQPWESLVHNGNKHLVNEEALDLMDKMLVYD